MNDASYKPSLPKFLTLCERNYANMNRLLPKEQKEGAANRVSIANEEYEIKVLDNAKYTTDVSITQCSSNVGLFTPPINVRVYHDAKVAEVVHPDYHSRIKPSYGYPNPKMHQKDEKYQVNAFLHDWLSFCMSHGEAVLDWDLDNGVV